MEITSSINKNVVDPNAAANPCGLMAKIYFTGNLFFLILNP